MSNLEESFHTNRPSHKSLQGNQRLSPGQIREWENLHFGMFLHFGMSTYEGEEFSTGQAPTSAYKTALDAVSMDF